MAAATVLVGPRAASAQPGAVPPTVEPPAAEPPAAEPPAELVPTTTAEPVATTTAAPSEALPAAAAAAADDDGPRRRIEVGGFLGLDYFGDDIELGNSWAPEQIPGTSFLFGARVGFIAFPDLARGSRLDPQLGVEVESRLALASTGSATEGGRASYFAPVLGWRVQLVGRLRSASAWTPHLVVGAGGDTILTSSPFIDGDTDAEFHWGPGVSRHVFGNWDARLDLRHGLTSGRISGVVSTFEAQLGLSTGWDLGGGHGARPVADRDGDGDGIVDRLDECPAEPETVNQFRDGDGCPDTADGDGDGIMDRDDRCPTEPEVVNGVDDQDGCPELDEDNDGIVGSKDECSRLPEDVDNFQDADGCPDPDNDNDGIVDAVDVCPDEAETRNGFDDDEGCPDTIPEVVQEFQGTIEGITFASGKAIIRPASKPTLDKAAATLSQYASILMRIEGHTDDRGKRDRNLALSLQRADAVRQYLVAKGISPERMITVGHGPDVPRDDNKKPKGRERNRRIEFHILIEAPAILRLAGQAPPAPPAPTTQPTAPATQPTEPTPPTP